MYTNTHTHTHTHKHAHTHTHTHTNMHTEGWGLYTEYLGTELGFYTDPAQDFGRLTTEMMRAVRLVIDTGTSLFLTSATDPKDCVLIPPKGLHSKGWSRQQAIDYFKSYSAMADTDIEAEVDRYMVRSAAPRLIPQ